MLLQYKTRDWINTKKNEFSSNRFIREFLDLLADYLNNNNNERVINLENNDDFADLKADISNIIQDAIDNDNMDFFKFLIDNDLIKDIFTTEIEVSFSIPGNNYGRDIDETVKIIDYAFQTNRCKVAKLFFDNINDEEKKKFIKSMKLQFTGNEVNNSGALNNIGNVSQFLQYNPCFTKLVKPYLKNIEPSVALMLMKKTKLPNNVLNYIIGPMMNIKKTKRNRKVLEGKRNKTRKNRA